MKLKFYSFFVSLLVLLTFELRSQDTFSIVAVDSASGEVGSAGASCVDLTAFPSFTTDFLGELLPGNAAINTQAFYIEQNQLNARQQMQLGRTPSQAISWLEQNDAQGTPEIRQYGIAALINGSAQAAAFTGSQTNAYTGQRVGKNYSIQGNILLGPEILDSMEARFLSADGDLKCKLMAAMQGANVIGADTRCTSNGTSSLFAFLKVAQASDTFGNPSFLISVQTPSGSSIEPVDSLQILFDQANPTGCQPISGLENSFSERLTVYPNPAQNELKVSHNSNGNYRYRILSPVGKVVKSGNLKNDIPINLNSIRKGIYILSLENENEVFRTTFFKE